MTKTKGGSEWKTDTRSKFSAVIGLLQKIFSHSLHSSAKFISVSCAVADNALSIKPPTLSLSLRMTLAAHTYMVVHALSHVVCEWSAHTGTPVTGACQSEGQTESDVKGHTHSHTHTNRVDVSRIPSVAFPGGFHDWDSWWLFFCLILILHHLFWCVCPT